MFTNYREAARRAQSSNNLMTIGLAALDYHDRFKRLPRGSAFNEFGEMRHGWMTRLLPYMEDVKQGHCRVDGHLASIIPESSRWRSGWNSVRSQELSNGRFWRFTTSDGEHQVGIRVVVGRQPHVVQRKEDEGGHGTHAIVPVDKRMVLDKVEQVGRRHFA